MNRNDTVAKFEQKELNEALDNFSAGRKSL